MALGFGKRKTPDGTVVIRHETTERKCGFPDDAAGPAPVRKAAYGRLFGETQSVSHELIPQVPHIEVHACRRKQGRAVRVRSRYRWGARSADDQAVGRRRGTEACGADLLLAEPSDEFDGYMTNTLGRCGGCPIFRTTASHGSGAVITVITKPNRNPPGLFVRAPDWMRFCLCRRASRGTGPIRTK
jgi:hypothetical protein